MSSKKRSAAKIATKGVSKEALPQPVPNWPVLKPLLDAEYLELETLVESQILVVRNFWTPKLCKDYVAFFKTLPLTTTPGKPKKGEALRANDRYQINDPLFANRLWVETGLRELVTRDGDQKQSEYERLW